MIGLLAGPLRGRESIESLGGPLETPDEESGAGPPATLQDKCLYPPCATTGQRNILNIAVPHRHEKTLPRSYPADLCAFLAGTGPRRRDTRRGQGSLRRSPASYGKAPGSGCRH